jgi:hypothetical protein
VTRLTKDQAASVRAAIDLARQGRASLGQLGAAHDLAQSAGLTGCAAEIRAHVRALAADRAEPRRRAVGDVLTGVVSGIVTHALLGGLR